MPTSAIAKGLRRGGLSLLELIAVVTIIAILVTIVIVRISGQALEAKEHVCHQYKADLNTALERFLFDTGKLPDELEELHTPQYHPDPIPRCPVDQQDYDFDRDTGRIVGHTH